MRTDFENKVLKAWYKTKIYSLDNVVLWAANYGVAFEKSRRNRIICKCGALCECKKEFK